jgi:hypothetical protein
MAEVAIKQRRRRKCPHCGIISMRPCVSEETRAICIHYAAIAAGDSENAKGKTVLGDTS